VQDDTTASHEYNNRQADYDFVSVLRYCVLAVL
jgi:hypothetical protein